WRDGRDACQKADLSDLFQSLSRALIGQVLNNGECNFDLNHGPQRILRFLQDIVNIVLDTQCCWVLLLFALKFLQQLFRFLSLQVGHRALSRGP
ncbi:unnamed protein product, partial [Timema podura]|nr:unnamed protein product [Timema podura]